MAQPSDRVHTIDALRGLALLGMIVVHFNYYTADRGPGASQIQWTIDTLVADKFYPLFACLFGMSFAIQFERWGARTNFVWIYLRRLAWLMGFALVFIALTGYHVLEIYAAWGLVLLLIRKWSNRSLLLLALAWILVAPVRHFAIAMAETRQGVTTEQSNIRMREEFSDWPTYNRTTQQLEDEHKFVETAKLRVKHSLGELVHVTGLIGSSDAFFMFLIGMYVVRKGILKDPRGSRDFLIVAIVIGVITLLADGQLIHLPPFKLERLRVQVAYGTLLYRILNAQLLGIAYASALALWIAFTSAGAKVGQVLAMPGRMSLTNYVTQVVILEVFFGGFGFHIGISRLTGVIAAAVLFIVQIVVSRWWMGSFHYGPLEWLWRSATFASWAPFKK